MAQPEQPHAPFNGMRATFSIAWSAWAKGPPRLAPGEVLWWRGESGSSCATMTSETYPWTSAPFTSASRSPACVTSSRRNSGYRFMNTTFACASRAHAPNWARVNAPWTWPPLWLRQSGAPDTFVSQVLRRHTSPVRGGPQNDGVPFVPLRTWGLISGESAPARHGLVDVVTWMDDACLREQVRHGRVERESEKGACRSVGLRGGHVGVDRKFGSLRFGPTRARRRHQGQGDWSGVVDGSTVDVTLLGSADDGASWVIGDVVVSGDLRITPVNPVVNVTIVNGVVSAAPVDFVATFRGNTVAASWSLGAG